MDVLSAILACSLYFDDGLVRAIVQVNSDGNPLFVGDTVNLVSYEGVKTLDQARATLSSVTSGQGRAVVGLMGVPPEWAQALGHTTAELWDACTNLSIGSAKLQEFADDCAHSRSRGHAKGSRLPSRGEATRLCVARRYGTAVGMPKKFASEVLKAIASPAPLLSTPTSSADVAMTPAASGVFLDDSVTAGQSFRDSELFLSAEAPGLDVSGTAGDVSAGQGRGDAPALRPAPTNHPLQTPHITNGVRRP